MRVEGESHGPVVVPREHLASVGGSKLLTVPRKAWLQIADDSRQPLTLSLYELEDESFRRPYFRASVTAGVPRRIPPAISLLSLSSPAGLRTCI